MPGKKNFEKRIQILIDYYIEFGHLHIKQTDEYKGVKVGHLVTELRRERKNGLITNEEAGILTAMGFQWTGKCTPEQKLQELLDWLKLHGTLENLTAYSKMEVNGETINIGATVAYFRRLNKLGRLSLVQKSFLKSIGFPFGGLEETYVGLIDYYNKHGSLSELKRDVIYVYKGKKYSIGKQVDYIITRLKDGKLSEEEYRFFNNLGAFDKWKANKLRQWNNGKLSDELYKKYRLSEIDPNKINKGV